jgi:uncharacterized RDD family membrane protein YckC
MTSDTIAGRAPGGPRRPPLPEMRYAGFWVRLAAFLIDSVLLTVVILTAVLAIYGPRYFLHTSFIAGPVDVLIRWVFPSAAVLVLWRWRQATPGKMLFSARIVDAATGRPPTTGQLVGRFLAYLVSTIPLGLGFLWIAFDSRKQAWHDKLSGTAVVRKRPFVDPS